MAMTLRLDPDTHAALKARAEVEGRSMQEVVHSAITDYLMGREERLKSAISRIVTEDAQLLDRLSR